MASRPTRKRQAPTTLLAETSAAGTYEYKTPKRPRFAAKPTGPPSSNVPSSTVAKRGPGRPAAKRTAKSKATPKRAARPVSAKKTAPPATAAAAKHPTYAQMIMEVLLPSASGLTYETIKRRIGQLYGEALHSEGHMEHFLKQALAKGEEAGVLLRADERYKISRSAKANFKASSSSS